MINVLGLCRAMRERFPQPAPGTEIFKAVMEYHGKDIPYDTKIDLVKALASHWKRQGWAWDTVGATGAVLLEEGEEAVFHSSGVSIVKDAGPDLPGQIYIHPIQLGSINSRVVWF